MYITKIYLENVRCFDKLTIDFEKESSLILAGDNGAGKSAILRSIAMGLCDQNSAAALLRELSGEFVRYRKKKATIEIDLKRRDGKKYRIETTIKSLKAFEKVSQKLYELTNNPSRPRLITNEEDFPWDSIFASGYGAGIRTQGSSDFQHYVAVDAVYPLFRYDVPLQNPELAVRRLIDQARLKAKGDAKKGQEYADQMLNKIQGLLEPILNLGRKGNLLLTARGIKVKGYWGSAELGALGDGYKSTVTWLLDLISWWMLYASRKTPDNITGIVLIDEIEQHLHPQWQLEIMDMLTVAWPKVQFIASTHSPLVISGSGDIPIWTVENRTASKHEVSGWLAEDVYRKVMGLESSRPRVLNDKIERYRRLAFLELDKKLNKEKKIELRMLKKELQDLPPSDSVALTEKMTILLDKLRKQKNK